MNVVVLVGRLAQDPELRHTPAGRPVSNFTLAVTRPFANQQGERETDFIDIVVWGRQAETVAQYLGKGRLAAVKGRLQIRSYETADGQRRRVAEVVADDVRFLDRPRDQAPASGPAGGMEDDPFSGDAFDPFAGDDGMNNDLDDDVPF
ncbi:MAG TPA: single-stranded DNA-binding protein [Sphingobacteriaceae bacterium]|nr:single-stranded DNA-binding protein [Sphingobacteriaceae bacterium]